VATADDKWVKIVSQILGTVSLGISGYVFSINPGCGGSAGPVCPGYAFGDQWMLRSERAVLALAILVAITTIIVRLVLIGSVPDEIGQTGAGWSGTPETLRKITKMVEDQNESIDKLQGATRELVSSTAAQTLELIDGLKERITALEGSNTADREIPGEDTIEP
jgi:hypothetical protein